MAVQDFVDANVGLQRKYYNQLLDRMNRESAIRGHELNRQAGNFAGSALEQINEDLNAPQVDAATQANNEIERMRRAQALGLEGQNRALGRNIARSGLTNSAAGILAQNRNQQAYQNQLADLESSRLGLQNQFSNEALQRRSTLLNQAGSALSGVQLPGTDFSKEKSFFGKLLGGVGGLVGRGVGSIAGGIGSGFGSTVGKGLGKSLF